MMRSIGLFTNLKKVPEFVARFGDRIQRHYFNDGALTPTSVAAPIDLSTPLEQPTVHAAASRRDEVKISSVFSIAGLAAVPERGDDFRELGDAGYDSRKTILEVDDALTLGGSINLSIDRPMPRQPALVADDQKRRDRIFERFDEFDFSAIAPQSLVSSLQALKRV